MKYIKVCLRRALLSRRFFIALFCISIINFIGRPPWQFQDVLSFADNSDGFLYLTPALAGLSFSAIYTEDRACRIQGLIAVRCGKICYMSANAIAIIISSFLCVCLGKVISIFIAKMWLPWATESSVSAYCLRYMGNLLEEGHIVPFLICARLCEAAVCTMEVMLAACVSVYVSSKLIVWIAPIIGHFVCTYGLWYAGVPATYSVTRIIEGRLYNGPLVDTAILVFGIGGMITLLAICYIHAGKRGLENA